MDSKIKNVVFDLGGVLINLDFDNCLNAFRKACLLYTSPSPRDCS